MAETTALQAALPDYDITTELGRGAMGIVYLGTHRALGRTVAIKELPPSFAADDAVRERFLTEARVVASLDHPHVVVIHDFVDRSGHLALVMEHLPNGTVWDQFLHHGLAAPRACGLVLATLAGLHHAHDRGVMHRDIKPENLIFTHDWQLKVTDFGIAQVLSGAATMGTEEGAIVGTPAYMSPEQAEGRSCGPPADVYAAGAMLYEMLTGSLPFPSADSAMDMALARLNEDPVPIDSAGPGVPDAIAEATMHALVRSDSDRFQSAEDFGVALAEAAAFTWGPEWMTESGTAVQGSAAIVDAARTTDRRHAVGAPEVDAPAESPAGAESATDDAVVAPGGDDPTSTMVDTPATATPPTPEASAAAPPADPPVFEATPTAAVQPRQRERIAGANLNDLAPDDIMNLREVRGPGTPMPWLLGALVVLAAAIAIALSGLGSDPTPVNADGIRIAGDDAARSATPIEVDLTEPFAVDLPEGTETVAASFFGIPIGNATVEDGQLDPGYLQYTGAGVIELSADPVDGSDIAEPITVPVRASNSPYPTAPFVAAAMLGLGGFASVQANMRGLRARRFRLSPYLGLAFSGALTGAAVAVLGVLVLSTPASLSSVIVTAVLGALGSVLLGEGYRRWYRRRRLKRVAIARARR